MIVNDPKSTSPKSGAAPENAVTKERRSSLLAGAERARRRRGQRDEHTLSDVDLMVIGSVGLAELTPALRKAETHLGREVNATSYSTREFETRLLRRHFLSEVLKGT